MLEQVIDYYKIFPKISPEMSVQDIRQALEKLKKKADVITNRNDPNGPKLKKQIEAALKVFQDELSKREYDRKLDESRQEPPKEDPRQKQREELEHWRARAQSLYREKQFGAAKAAVKKAMEKDAEHSDSKLYALAAIIYSKNGEYETAIQYIDEAIALEPEAIKSIMSQAEIYFDKAEALAKGSRFQDSPQLQEEYRRTRAQGLESLDDVPNKWTSILDDALLAEALGMKAYELYFHPDKTDKAQAAEDKRIGLCYAEEAMRISFSMDAQNILAVEAEKKAERDKWKRLAREHRDNEEYAQGRNAVLQALSVDVVDRSSDAYLYWLAADIYYSEKKYDAALGYINKALELEPDDVYDLVLKGMIYGRKALQSAENSRFQSSPELKREYRRLRDLELETLRDVSDKAELRYQKNDGVDEELVGYALGKLAYTLYFRPDQLDAKRAKADRQEGINNAKYSELHYGCSEDTGEVLKDLEED